MAECQDDGCSGHADAKVYHVMDTSDGSEAIEKSLYCRTCALEDQMYGDPPAAVVWTSAVDVDLRT